MNAEMLPPLESLIETFTQKFGKPHSLVLSCAPGRVNLIGEHTDYNGGFVLPVAMECSVALLGAPNGLGFVRLFSANFNEEASFPVGRARPKTPQVWANYPQGIVDVFLAEGFPLSGFDAVVAGDVPIGSGLSSSAAFEVATALLLKTLFDLEIPPTRLALLAQKAENEFVGVGCGIMDQFISLFAREGSALLLDCEDLSYRHLPLDASRAVIVVADTGVRRELSRSAYNARRAECSEAVRILTNFRPGLSNLRGITLEDFRALKSFLPQPIRKRAMHVVTENERTLQAAKALENRALETFGLLMNHSHESLRFNYEVSCPELDLMVEIARGLPGTLGSRMTGAGFGGSVVTLVLTEAVGSFVPALKEGYKGSTGIVPQVYVSKPASGASAQWVESQEFGVESRE